MPLLSGIETTDLVKRKYPQIKSIMLTAFDNDERIFNGINAGADGYLLKEINSLSAREIEVLEQLSKDLSYTTIAVNLFLSPSTVRKHIENSYKKLHAHGMIEAVQKDKKHSVI